MLRAATEYLGLSIHATDGDLGTVSDLYFDGERFLVRHVVADTGTILPGRRVLLAPAAVAGIDWAARRLSVRITRAEIERSPGVDADRPAGPPRETGDPLLGGAILFDFAAAAGGLMGPPAAYLPEGADPGDADRGANPRLRSVAETTDYAIEADDGAIGHLDDFLVGEEDWTIRYLVVDTSDWWIGRKVLVSPEWVESIRWDDRQVRVDLSRDAIRSAPPYDPTTGVTREYETRLHEAHGRPGYWTTPRETPPRRRA